MKRYGIRAAKYTIQMGITLIIVIGILMITGTDNASMDEVFHSNRGLLMLGIFAIFIFAYPFMGYTTKTLVFDANKKDAEIDSVMEKCGYAKITETPTEKVYRAKSVWKRFLRSFEDTVTITTIDEVSYMEGPRKEVVNIYFRMGTYITEKE